MSVVFPVNPDTRFRITTAVGGELTFSVPFPFQDNDDIAFIRLDPDGAETELSEGQDYSLTGAGNPSGGTASMAVPASAGSRYLRVGRAILDRVTSITRLGRFKSAAIDDDIDRWIIIAQELARDLDRTIKVPLGSSVQQLSAPEANKFWRWNATADKVEFVDILQSGDLAVSSFWQALLTTSTADAVRTALGIVLISTAPTLFGGVGDGNGIGGGTDATAAIQLAINFAGANSLNLLGRTWRVDGQLALRSNFKIYNGTLDFTNRPNASYAGVAGGTDGTAAAVGTLTAGANTITVPNGALFAAGRWIFIKSADIFDFAASTKGEWQRIKSIAGNVLTLFSLLRDSYATTVQVFQPTLKSDIVLEDVTFIGGGNGLDQKGLYLSHTYNLQVRNCVFKRFHNRDLDIRRSIHPKVIGCHFEDGDGTTGNSYGVCIVNGNEGAVVDACSGDNKRHLVTIGGEDGIDWGPVVQGCTGNNMSDSFIDCHSGCWDFVFANNTGNSLHPSVDADENRHGMTIQGARGVVIGNKLRGFKGIGIHYQPLTKEAQDSITIVGNNLQSSEAATVGIYVDSQKTGGALEQVLINDNVVRVSGATSQGIVVEVQNAASADISGMNIEGNNVRAPLGALVLRTAALKFMSDVIISGRYRSDGTTDPVIALYAGTTTTYMTAISIRAVVRGGSYGIRNVSDFAGKVLVDGCTIQGFATAATLGTLTTGTNIII